jgi:hypothetical protein
MCGRHIDGNKRFNIFLKKTLIEEAPAFRRLAEARNLELIGLNWEFVVVSDFLATEYVTLGVNDNLFHRLYGDNLGIAVGLWKRSLRSEQYEKKDAVSLYEIWSPKPQNESKYAHHKSG